MQASKAARLTNIPKKNNQFWDETNKSVQKTVHLKHGLTDS